MSISLTVAGDGVFSSDGRHVYLLRFDGTATLARVDRNSGEQSILPLAAAIGDRPPVGLAREKTGRLLCATNDAVWRFDASFEEAEKICDTGESGRRFRDIACDTDSGRVLIAAVIETKGRPPIHELLVLRAAGETPSTVRMRRIDRIDGMTFTSKGSLLFGHRGDLWLGRVRREIIPQGSEDPVRAAELAKLPPYVRSTLQAYRWAPLATLETADSTGAQIGVDAVVISTSHVYVHLFRMGGSGWGKIVRLPVPAAARNEGDSDDDFDRQLDLEVRLEIYRKALAGVENLGEAGRPAQMCTSPDGTTVHFIAGGKHWLATDGEIPRSLSVGESQK